MPMEQQRNRAIIHCNLIGIGLNLFLGAIKLTLGLVIHSRAIVLESVEALADILISLISIGSAVLVGKQASRRHPMGYGRIEYLSSLLVTLVILFLGLHAVYGAIRELLEPNGAPDYSLWAAAVLAVSVAVKWFDARHMQHVGKHIHSASLVMMGAGSFRDALISVGILAAMLIHWLFSVDIEAWLSLLISLAILKTGVEMIRESADKLLGARLDPSFRRRIYNRILTENEVLNVYNLALHNYGVGRFAGSVDIEVDEALGQQEIARLTRRIIRQVREEGVTLTSVGFSCVNRSDPRVSEIEDRVLECAMAQEGVARVQGLMADFEEGVISFYVVPDLNCPDWSRGAEALRQTLSGIYPDMRVEIDSALDF